MSLGSCLLLAFCHTLWSAGSWASENSSSGVLCQPLKSSAVKPSRRCWQCGFVPLLGPALREDDSLQGEAPNSAFHLLCWAVARSFNRIMEKSCDQKQWLFIYCCSRTEGTCGNGQDWDGTCIVRTKKQGVTVVPSWQLWPRMSCCKRAISSYLSVGSLCPKSGCRKAVLKERESNLPSWGGEQNHYGSSDTNASGFYSPRGFASAQRKNTKL